MKDENKTKEQLINELVELRQRSIELEASKAERKQMETMSQKIEKIQNIDKFKDIGAFADGIANDFNNLLLGITGYIALARLFSNERKVLECLTEAEEVAFQARDLIKQLVIFAKGGEAPVKEKTDISELLKGTAEFVLRGANIRCEFSIPENLWWVEIDEEQISQVISNLVAFEKRSMPKGGIIRIKAQNFVVSKKGNLPLKAGKYIEIILEDEGVGIPEADLSKVFDPYFSTKKIASGLGLSICPSMIKNHDGHISVNSQEGVGTVFRIYLPAIPKEISIEKSPKTPVISREATIIMVGGKVLVMDDEDYVRDVASQMLRLIGYEVEVAKDGNETVELYQKAKDSRHPFNVVILDLSIPGGMGGKETVKKLTEIDPNVKAIASTGHLLSDPVVVDYRQYGFNGLIVKPYDMEDLNEILRKVI